MGATGKLADLVLGRGARQRTCISQTLLGLVIYAVFAAVQQLEVLLGLIDQHASNLLTAWNLAGVALFYGLIRSGLNARLGPDPSLTVAQMAWAMVGVAGSYAITGPARGAILPIMLLVIVFGVFALTPAQSRALSGFGVCLLAGVMVYKGATDPLRYEPVVEALHLVFTAIVVGAVSALASRLSQLRSRLVDQRQQLAAALERIQAMATRDDLTGLLNRRAAMERFTEALGALPRRSAAASVVLIDLDHFKAVNDTHGHAAGDEVLRGFAEVARASLRTHDLLARWGGEEFLLVLPGADPADAALVLTRLREELAGRTFDAAAPGLRVTFSAGVARCGGLDDVEASIARADAAMYGAKTGGRNRTELTA